MEGKSWRMHHGGVINDSSLRRQPRGGSQKEAVRRRQPGGNSQLRKSPTNPKRKKKYFEIVSCVFSINENWQPIDNPVYNL